MAAGLLGKLEWNFRLMDLKKIIYLPIETKSRELDSKLLIGLSSIREDVAVVIPTNRFSLLKPEIPAGVVLLKSAAGYEIDYINALKKSGMKCCVMDEEGVVHTNDEREHALRFSQDTLDSLEKIFFNGVAESNLMNNFYKIPVDKFVITGNPRFDFYKQQFNQYYLDEAAQLRKEFGRYLLMPSRFSMVNIATNDESDEAYLNFLKNFYVKSDQELNIFRGMLKHGKNIFNAFLTLMPELSAALPHITIVIRPHPSESSRSWEDACSGLKNIKVIGRGPIGPWLSGAEAVLHNGCTTGFEAFLMGKKVFSYMPYTSEQYDLKLPNQVSKKFYDSDSLIKALRASLDTKSEEVGHDEEQMQFAEKYLANARPSQMAYEKVSEELLEVLSTLEHGNIEILKQPFALRVKNKFKKFLATLLLANGSDWIKFSKKISLFAYSYKKNPGFTKKEIQASLSKLSNIIDLDINMISVDKLDEDLFVMYKNCHESRD